MPCFFEFQSCTLWVNRCRLGTGPSSASYQRRQPQSSYQSNSASISFSVVIAARGGTQSACLECVSDISMLLSLLPNASCSGFTFLQLTSQWRRSFPAWLYRPGFLNIVPVSVISPLLAEVVHWSESGNSSLRQFICIWIMV